LCCLGEHIISTQPASKVSALISGLFDCVDTVVTQTINYMTGDPAFAVDRRGVIVLWNSAVEKLLGYPASTALGKYCWKLLSGQDTNGNQYCYQHCALREMAFQRKPVSECQLRFKTASEGRKQYAISCIVVFDGPGNDLLLHTCRLEAATRKNGDNVHTVNKPSSNHARGALTSRELEILTLLADGKNTQEIASLMCISDRTVSNHIQHALYELHVHNRLEAVVKGKRLDLI
jgi:DNA-binding CsgD family transcriptional regulator